LAIGITPALRALVAPGVEPAQVDRLIKNHTRSTDYLATHAAPGARRHGLGGEGGRPSRSRTPRGRRGDARGAPAGAGRGVRRAVMGGESDHIAELRAATRRLAAFAMAVGLWAGLVGGWLAASAWCSP
jgi:hypothetical protein